MTFLFIDVRVFLTGHGDELFGFQRTLFVFQIRTADWLHVLKQIIYYLFITPFAQQNVPKIY